MPTILPAESGARAGMNMLEGMDDVDSYLTELQRLVDADGAAPAWAPVLLTVLRRLHDRLAGEAGERSVWSPSEPARRTMAQILAAHTLRREIESRAAEAGVDGDAYVFGLLRAGSTPKQIAANLGAWPDHLYAWRSSTPERARGWADAMTDAAEARAGAVDATLARLRERRTQLDGEGAGGREPNHEGGI
jgi:hypothetical protein